MVSLILYRLPFMPLAHLPVILATRCRHRATVEQDLITPFINTTALLARSTPGFFIAKFFKLKTIEP
jgi:hypothetical protein